MRIQSFHSKLLHLCLIIFLPSSIFKVRKYISYSEVHRTNPNALYREIKIFFYKL
jgi:hypothetical protein